MASTLSRNPAGTMLIIVLSVFLFFDLLVVGLRLWARRIKKKKLALNDWAIILSLVFMLALYTTELIVVILGGVGLHIDEVYETMGKDALLIAGKGAFAADLFWNASITSVKVSILDLYITIFRNEAFRKMTYGVIALSVTCGVGFILEEFLICHPLSFYWDQSVPGGWCGNEQIAYLVPGVINMGLDILIFGLPMPLLWHLQMPVTKKVVTSVIFGIGLLICILSGVRLKFVLAIDYSDFTYTIVDFAIFGALEPLLAIISACLPILQPVLAKLSDKIPLSWSRKKIGYSKPHKATIWQYPHFRAGGNGGLAQGSAFEELYGNAIPLVETRIEGSRLRDGSGTSSTDTGGKS